METLLQDLRFGLRMLLKNPGFTAAAMLSLGLGIGVNTTIFTFVNALLLRPPSVEAPGDLLEVWNWNRKAGSSIEAYLPLSYPDYLYYRNQNRSLAGLLAYDGDSSSVNWNMGGEAAMIRGQLVSGNFFSVLGVKAALGRTFLPEEDRTPGTHPVVILSHRFWSERLASDPNVVGKALTLNGHSFTVVGVTPADFSGMVAGLVPDFWAPMMTAQQITHRPDQLTTRNSYWLLVVGRRKPGVTASQAGADLTLVARQLEKTYPDTDKVIDVAVFSAASVPGPFRGYVAAFTGLFMAVVGLVLLIACANAANVLLAKALSRSREMAVRAAMGARRARLVRQMLTESVLLGLFSGGIGVMLALWTAPALLKLKPPTVPIRLDVPMDWRVLGFTFLVSLLAGMIFGLAPALQSSKHDLVTALKDEVYGSYRKSRLRSLLVVAQVALCLVLLIAAGLCLKSFLRAQSIDPGFEIRNRLAVTFDLRTLAYSEQQGRQFYERLLERVRALPSVESAALADYLPLGTASRGTSVSIEGHTPPPGQEGIPINTFDVGPDYFRAMGTPVLRGREFGRKDDASAPRVVIINEAIASRFWRGRDPVGLRLKAGAPGGWQNYEIIGVVKTGKYRTLSENPRPFAYFSLLQRYHSKQTLIAHTADDPRSVMAAVQREVRSLDPNLAIVEMVTLQQHMAFALFTAQVTGTLLSALGLLATVLAMLGLYGVIAYSVSQRTREIGVRMALGAGQRDVMKLVVGQGAMLALIGVGIGLAAAFALTRFLSSLLYGVRATDPLTFTVVSVLFLAVAIFASYLPARRAANVDPMVALRYE
ncbi:MAG TPA: ABC transporter permease [Acidobacteriota bacterium]|jgi:predicted permease|nr:ABC transporter permease [Acidobacteriota bacterium]